MEINPLEELSALKRKPELNEVLFSVLCKMVEANGLTIGQARLITNKLNQTVTDYNNGIIPR